MVGSSLKQENLSTQSPSTSSLIWAAFFFNLLTPPRFGVLNRESESSGSQPVYRKLFPRGPHSSTSKDFEIKISRPTPLDSLSVLLWLLVEVYPFYGVTLTPILTPNLRSFLHLKKISFNSENGVNFTPYMGYFNSFWSYLKSENGVNILGAGYLLFVGYFDSSISGVIFTPENFL